MRILDQLLQVLLQHFGELSLQQHPHVLTESGRQGAPPVTGDGPQKDVRPGNLWRCWGKGQGFR